MFKIKTYKSKFIMLVAGFILSLIIIYIFAIKKSIDAVTLYEQSKSEMELVKNAPLKLTKLNAELDKISNIIVSGSTTTEELRQKLFAMTSEFCNSNKIQLIEMADPVIFKKSGYKIITHSLILSGSFNKLLSYVYFIEQETKFIKITSSEFYLEQLRSRKKSKKLYLKLYFQNLEKSTL